MKLNPVLDVLPSPPTQSDASGAAQSPPCAAGQAAARTLVDPPETPVTGHSTDYLASRLRVYADEFRQEGNYSHGIYADQAAERLSALSELTKAYANAFGADYIAPSGPVGLSAHLKTALADTATAEEVAFALKAEGALYALGSDWGTSPLAHLLLKAARLLAAPAST